MVAEQSRSRMDSPVSASMFAPEPSSPGVIAARLHSSFNLDCSKDGKALDGKLELDLTSKMLLVRPECTPSPLQGSSGLGWILGTSLIH
uniref:Uncharacterized protein n=1 Tax=Monodon monoceros TaxID=40151 RepID=A0A8C6AUR9_MONMO